MTKWWVGMPSRYPRRGNRMDVNKGLEGGERSTCVRIREAPCVWNVEGHRGSGHMNGFMEFVLLSCGH
jgi:hypothetical protein